MSNPYTGHVSAALRKAQLLLDIESDTPLVRTALLEAAVMELWRAYRAFLAELAFQLHLGGEPESIEALAELAGDQGKSCSQLVELQELFADSDSWLTQLQAAWTGLWDFSETADKRVQKVDLIPLRDLSTSKPSGLSETLLRKWHAALTELVQRQRAQAEEW